MTAVSYPFIDLAVLDGVREPLAAGDAVLLLSENLDVALLANAAGAQLAGFEGPFDLVGENPDLGLSAVRQIKALELPQTPGSCANIGLRLNGGIESRLVMATIRTVFLPGGEHALVLSWPIPEKATGAAIQAMADDTTHFALIANNGEIVAASDKFATLDLPEFDLAQLSAQALTARDRMVKRRLKSGDRFIPVGIGRLRDDPALFILLAISEIAPATLGINKTADATQPTAIDSGSQNVEPADTDHADELSSEAASRETGPKPQTTPFASRDVAAAEIQTAEASVPVRFTWKIDAAGKFSYVSPEFGDAIGKNSADVIGRTFKDVATVFAFDNSGEIADLLARRDTWSGRSVLWPIEGTDLRAPIDLAALPSYDRMRNFEGFRGFGIVRIGDAVLDPEGLGLVLGAGNAPGAMAQELSHGSGDDTLNDPWQGEVPALVMTPPVLPVQSDDEKIVVLDERRHLKDQLNADLEKRQLTPVERSAFREIADRLRGDGPTVERPPVIIPEVKVLVANSEQALDITSDHAPLEQSHDADYSLLVEAEPLVPPVPSLEAAHISEDAPILSKLPVPVLIHNGSGLLYGNPAFFELTQYASLEALQQEGGLDHLLHVSTASQDGTESSVIVTAENTETRVRARLHTVRWKGEHALLLSLSPLQTDQSLEATHGTEIDGLKREISELSSVLETATDGVVFVNPDGTIRSINQSAEALFGFDPSAVNGKPFTHLLATESQRLANDYIANLGRTGVASLINDGREVIGREARGRFIPLFMTVGKLEQDSGFCVVLRDITQWKRAEEDLKAAKRAAENASTQKSEFLARVSHEIRTPLNAIIGFSEMMSEERFGPIGSARYLDYLNDIHRSGRHVLDLVNDLLDISKIEAGQQELNFESVELNDALAEAVSIMQPQANRERVIIRSAFASELPEVVADVRTIKQIALNLLANAVRYTGAGGQVIISTSYELTGGVAIRVRDTGIGMNPQEIEHALKPFKQINTLKRERGDGTGLGLPLTKAMVEANRASFSISSKPGEGTLIEITFPSTRVLAD